MAFADFVKDLLSELPKVQGNPMLSSTPTEQQYRDNPLYKADELRTRDQLNLEEEERKRVEAQKAKSGMFSSNGESKPESNTYYQDEEDKFFKENLAMGATPEAAKTLAKQQAFELQSANNSRIHAGLSLFGNTFIPGMSTLNALNYGTSTPDYLMGNYRRMIGDNSGYQSFFRPKPEGVAAPVVSGQSSYNDLSIQAKIANDILSRQAENEAMFDVYKNYTGFRGNSTDGGYYISSYDRPHTQTYGSMSDDTARGLAAARETYGYGSDANYYGD